MDAPLTSNLGQVISVSATPDSSLLTPHSSLLTPHSSLLTPHSSLLTRHSSFCLPRARNLSPFVASGNCLPNVLAIEQAAKHAGHFPRANVPSAVPGGVLSHLTLVSRIRGQRLFNRPDKFIGRAVDSHPRRS